jgi:DNA polymerase IV
VELKVRSSEFRTRTRALSLTDATNSTQALWPMALELFERSLKVVILPARLLGVGATTLVSEQVVQGDLFEDEARKRQAALDQAVDTIRQRLAADAIQRGSLLSRKVGESPDASA